MIAKFQKTSLQLSPMVLHDMGHWPGLTQSEALRLSVERGHYLSSLNSEAVADLADEYAPILREALQDLGYEDYRLVVRSLPAIVEGFLCEENRAWNYERGDQHELKPGELIEKLRGMNAIERIGVLDCIVAERQRRFEVGATAQETSRQTQAPRAADFEREVRERWRLAQVEGASYVDINAGEVHRKLGGYPGPGNAMANCCQVMERLREASDQVRESPRKGKGASLTIRYFLPRSGKSTAAGRRAV